MFFSTTAKTNKHTFRHKANLNWESQKLIIGNTATLRVKFTLTKLQKTLRETELRQIAQPQKLYQQKKKFKTKLFILQTHIGQANRKPKAKQMHSKLKLQAVGLRHISKIFGKLLLSS